MRLTCSVHTFWYWITTGFCLESGFVSVFHMEIWLYQASILTTKPWIGVEVPGRFSPCLSAPYAITNGIWKCLGVCGWNSCLIRTKICHQFNLHLDKIWTDWTLGKNWMMLPSQNQLSSLFSLREGMFPVLRLFWGSWPGHWRWELWGRAASTSVYIFILLILPSGLAYPLLPREAFPATSKDAWKKPSSLCGSLSFLWILGAPCYKLQAQ